MLKSLMESLFPATKPVDGGSKKYKLNKKDLPALLKAAGVGAALALVAWLSGFAEEVDYGALTPAVMAVVPPALAALKRMLSDYDTSRS